MIYVDDIYWIDEVVKKSDDSDEIDWIDEVDEIKWIKRYKRGEMLNRRDWNKFEEFKEKDLIDR